MHSNKYSDDRFIFFFDSNKNYSFKRIQELAGISLCLFLIVYCAINFLYYFDYSNLSFIFYCLIFAFLTADFLSGLVHWAADSYGSVESFLIGRNLKSFREHHIDPASITYHNFIETNGDNFTLVIPLMLYITYNLYAMPSFERVDTNFLIYLYYLFLVCLLIALTNQFHKWAHAYHKLPRIILILQKLHIILPRAHHHLHHIKPNNKFYCITSGWLNYPLERIGFWNRLENLIFKTTGVSPRL